MIDSPCDIPPKSIPLTFEEYCREKGIKDDLDGAKAYYTYYKDFGKDDIE